MTDQTPRDQLIEIRMAKARTHREAGANPFVNRWLPTHKAAEIREKQADYVDTEKTVRVAGRALTIRSFGKTNFFHLLDESGRIQVCVVKNIIAPEDYEVFAKRTDTGDIVGVEGTLFITRTGELTVNAKSFHLLSKAYRPLPEKWAGLTNVETRYRKRYLDLVVNEDVRETFRRRSRIIASIRRQLDARGYLEVETPMMQPIYGGAAARPFITHHNALDMALYLRIAPELYLKRLLVGGFEKVYEINRNFRNEGISVRHNPEFTMLELYTAWWDYTDTMNLLEEILRTTAREVLGVARFSYQGRELDFESPFARHTMLELVREALKLPEDCPLAWGPDNAQAVAQALAAAPEAVQAEIREKGGNGDEILVGLFEACAEPEIWQPTIVYDFPKSLCPLAKCKQQDPHTAERFELFVGGLETANAYSELNDPEEQEANFRDQVRRREAGDKEATMMDEDYVQALEQGMPPASGLGIGIDRLVMLLTDSASIRDVILFPLMRPEQE